MLLHVVIARLTTQRQKNVRAQIGQCETVGRYESDIARFSVMNEVFDDVDRSGSGIAMFRYVDLANIRSAQRPVADGRNANGREPLRVNR